MGVAKCRECAAQSVWWPRIAKDIKSRVATCRHCLEKQPSQASEPLLPSALTDRPFQKVGTDICEFRNKHYLVQVDYYSSYTDVIYLPSLTSAMVIGKLKNCFSHHGIPETVVSDNGTQSRQPRSHQNRWRKGLEVVGRGGEEVRSTFILGTDKRSPASELTTSETDPSICMLSR